MKRRSTLFIFISALALQSSVLYVHPHPPCSYIDPFSGIALPMSLYGYSAPSVWEEAKAVEYYCNIPTDLLKALILWESGGKLKAYNVNKNGSIDLGPAQLNSACLNGFSLRYNGGKPINPCSIDSVRIAGKMLADSYSKYGSWRAAIQHYNYRAKGYADFVFKCYLRLKGLD
jgi:hypothetical protein